MYKKFDSVCKERLGEFFGVVMSMVPKAGLTKKVSPVGVKKKCKEKESKKKFVKGGGNEENSWVKKRDVSLHPAQ